MHNPFPSIRHDGWGNIDCTCCFFHLLHLSNTAKERGITFYRTQCSPSGCNIQVKDRSSCRCSERVPFSEEKKRARRRQEIYIITLASVKDDAGFYKVHLPLHLLQMLLLSATHGHTHMHLHRTSVSQLLYFVSWMNKFMRRKYFASLSLFTLQSHRITQEESEKN